MKYLLSILCLFIFSCDSGGDDAVEVEGCTDGDACNFNTDATVDDGSCEYGQWTDNDWPDCSSYSDDDDEDSSGNDDSADCEWEEVCDWESVYVSLGSDSYCTNSCIDGTYCQNSGDCYFNNGFAGSGCNSGYSCVTGEYEQQWVCDWVCE